MDLHKSESYAHCESDYFVFFTKLCREAFFVKILRNQMHVSSFEKRPPRGPFPGIDTLKSGSNPHCE